MPAAAAPVCERSRCHGTSCHAQVIRRIDVPPRDIRWADSGELVALIGEASFYVLRYDRGAVEAALEAGGGDDLDEDGIDDAFTMETETSEAVRTGARKPLLGFVQCLGLICLVCFL